MVTRLQQVQRIAARYRSEGYEVTVDPSSDLMPERLGWLRADLIAQRGDEHLLVLLGGEDNQLQFLADVVSDLAGWRFVHFGLED